MDKTDFQRDVSFRDEILKKKDDIKSKIYSIFAGDVEVDDGI